MTTMTAEKALPALQEKRKSYKKLSGESLRSALAAKFDSMSCIREDEIEFAKTRRLKTENGVVMDVTDVLNPKEVPADEVYLIGWK